MVDVDSANIEEYRLLQHAADHAEEQAVGMYWKEDRWFVVLTAITILGVVAFVIFGLLALLGFILGSANFDLGPLSATLETLQSGNLIGIVLASLALFILIMLLVTRHKARRNFALYHTAGCPECYEHDMVRIRRQRRDRVVAALGFPVRRYACRNCIWMGLRLHEDRPLQVEKHVGEAMTIDEPTSMAPDESSDLREPLQTSVAPPPAIEIRAEAPSAPPRSSELPNLVSQDFMPLGDTPLDAQGLILPPVADEEPPSEFDFSSIVFDDVVDPVRQAELNQFRIDLESMTIEDETADEDSVDGRSRGK